MSNPSVREVLEDLEQVHGLVLHHDYRLAEQEALRIKPRVHKLNRPDLEIRLARFLGGSQLGLNRYREALKTLLPARDAALTRRDFKDLWAIDGNLAWVYLEMNNLSAAADLEEQAVESARLANELHPEALLSRAFISGKLRDFPRAEAQFSEAIDAALEAGQVEMASKAWHLLGDAYLESLPQTPEPLRSERLARAESAETEAFRLRILNHSTDLDESCRELARILAERHDYRTATVLMDEAVAMMGGPRSTGPVWFFLASRGQLRAMKGDLPGALVDLRAALELAKRIQIVPTDDDRVTFESGLADVYALFIDVGNRLYLRNSDPALKAEVFEAAAANRAASLLALAPQPHGWRTRLPEEHGQVLARLEVAERRQLIDGDSKTNSEVRALRATLHEIESRAGADEGAGNTSALEVARRALDSDSAILAFHLSGRSSWIWTITKDDFQVAALPSKEDLSHSIARLRDAVRDNRPEWRDISAEVGLKLLSGAPAAVHSKRRWIVELDQELFDLPLAAVTWNGKLLVEDHTLVITPGVRHLDPPSAARVGAGPLLGVGDPIYNRADSRLNSSQRFAFFNSPSGQTDWALARLSASGPEVLAARDAWGAGRVLTGFDATKENLLAALRGSPSILHLATHVVAGPDRSGVIVLGMDGTGQPEVLDMREIVTRSMGRPLVVMSGCASGDGRALPASGLMGLTRAWMGAGAQEVLATRWPALDDSGPFFSNFYRSLRQTNGRGAAEALRNAQLAMLHSRGFRSNPAYWASYFLVGKV